MRQPPTPVDPPASAGDAIHANRLAPTRPRRWWHAALLVAVGYAVAAVPAFALLMISAFGFSGCFLTCGEPDVVQGWVAVAGLVLLLAAPLVVGMAFVKRLRALWVSGVVLLVASLLVLF